MSNDKTNVATVKTQSLPALAMSEDDLISVLTTSLYPGAAIQSIKMVLGYCRAAGLDPMQKPVHIVPMDVAVKDARGTVTYQKRDVIMPGIGLYRTQAARSGNYAGVSEPEYGGVKKIPVMRKQYNNRDQNDKTFSMVPDGEIEFPEWCKVTVKRLVGNVIVDFTAKEFWLENYATAGKDSTAPNAMWKRRPYGQIAKCAEAQALRKAFPEFGSAPTADEMEGKQFEGETIDGVTGEIAPKNDNNQKHWSDTDFEIAIKKQGKMVSSGDKTAADLLAWMQTKAGLTDAQKAAVLALKKDAPVVDGEVIMAEESAAIQASEIEESKGE